MKAVDDRLLEYLDAEGVGSPKTISEKWPYEYHPETLGRRLRLLLQIELVEKVGRGVYRISPKGRGYLAGEQDLLDVEKPD